MNFLTELFSGTGGNIVKSIGDVADKFVYTKEEKAQADLEMKKAENQYLIDMKKLGIDAKKLDIEEQNIYLIDTQNARNRESTIATSKEAPWYVKIVAPILAILTTLLTFTLFYILVFRSKLIQDDGKDVIIYILGVLSAILTQIFSYYFGSSQGSSDKNRQITDLVSQKSASNN